MSSKKIDLQFLICSKCSSHRNYTRHVEEDYINLADKIASIIQSRDSAVDVKIHKAGIEKMGAFQILCNGRIVFSKLKLGYFPDVEAVTERIMTYIREIKENLNQTFYTNSYTQRDNRSYSATNLSKVEESKSIVNDNPEFERRKLSNIEQILEKKRELLFEQYKMRYPNATYNQIMTKLSQRSPHASKKQKEELKIGELKFMQKTQTWKRKQVGFQDKDENERKSKTSNDMRSKSTVRLPNLSKGQEGGQQKKRGYEQATEAWKLKVRV